MRFMLAACCVLMAGCGGGVRPTPAVYDMGLEGAPGNMPILGRIEVAAPSWLTTTAMQYRLAAEPGRRYAFTESRWVGVPAEMMETSLRRMLGVGTGRCRLRLDLDEWIQAFAADGTSQARLALRAAVIDGRGEPLARRDFSFELPAGRDARDGVAAYGVIRTRLADELRAWLPSLSADACRAG